jgi:hypothetical protein
MYILPHYRITTYFIGIWLAFELRRQRNTKLNDRQLTRGRMTVIASIITTGIICGSCESEMKVFNGLYASVASISVCLPLVWIIFTSEVGHKSEVIS